MALLEIDGLQTHFFTDQGVLPAVDGVSFNVDRGETVGLVGESGCGKSVTAMSVLRLVPQPPGRIVGGRVRFGGRDLLRLPMRELRRVRGNDIAMIFQEPMTALNPVYTVGDQIIEAITLHQRKTPSEARLLAIRMLEEVGIAAAATRVDAFAHQMSGGMKQRVMIAMALCCNPELLIADEPTTALDVTIQAQILELLQSIQRQRGMAVLLITHHLGVVAQICQRVVVMYAGRVAEEASTRRLFDAPAHPYTAGLLACLPERAQPGARLPVIEGTVPSPLHFPSGCRFRDRCARATDACREQPEARLLAPGHRVACHHPLVAEGAG